MTRGTVQHCLRAIPYVEAWAEKYKTDGLVVIGAHTPEFAFEKDQSNVSKSVRDLKITYPVAIDSNYAIWKAFNNEYWPAYYFNDKQGTICYHHFGEGKYDKSEEAIQQLLKENNANIRASGTVQVNAAGVQTAADLNDVPSPETYVGYERVRHFASPEAVKQAFFVISGAALAGIALWSYEKDESASRGRAQRSCEASYNC